MQAENDRLQAESKKLESEITELSKNIVSRNDSLENKLVVLKQMELQLATSIRL